MHYDAIAAAKKASRTGAGFEELARIQNQRIGGSRQNIDVNVTWSCSSRGGARSQFSLKLGPCRIRPPIGPFTYEAHVPDRLPSPP